RHAADATHPFPDRRRIGMLVELEQDAAGNLAEVHRPDIGGCPSEISRQMAEEQRSVPALEAELVIVHEHHGTQPGPAQPSSAASARARSSSSGVFTFMTATCGPRQRATSASVLYTSRHATKTPALIRLPTITRYYTY